MRRFNWILAVLTAIFLIGSQFPSAQADECKKCSKRKQAPSEFSMERIACIDENDLATFDRNWCASLTSFADAEDFFTRLNKCEAIDPKKRTTSLEMLTSLQCDSFYLDKFKSSLKRQGYPIRGTTVSAPTVLILDSNNITGTTGFLINLIRDYRERGKGKGYPELKALAATLNRQDDNGYTFLDNVVLRFNDEFIEKIGLGFGNIRKRLITVSCKIGGRFTSAENMQKFSCVPGQQYVQ